MARTFDYSILSDITIPGLISQVQGLMATPGWLPQGEMVVITPPPGPLFAQTMIFASP